MTSQNEENKTGATENTADKTTGNTAGNSTGSNQSSSAQDEAGQELIDELTRLGQKFVEVVEVAWNSEQRKQIEEDLRTGLVTVAGSLEEGFKRVSKSKEAQEAVNAAEDVAEKVRSSKFAVELSDALAKGLRALSEQMEKLTEEMKEKSTKTGTGSAASKNSSDTQDIPIARDDQS
jgi:hypothetical protein